VPQQIQQRPPYPITSVDNALRLIQLLRDGGDLRLTDAAAELQIAPSTAHRLMAMLVYRGFAVQSERRRYSAGPALGARAVGAPWIPTLRHLAHEPMSILCATLGETVNLAVRVGANVRFLATVEAEAVLRIGDRTGAVLPAMGTSVGKALLAYEPQSTLRALYRGRGARVAGSWLDEERYEQLLQELEQVRSSGYGINREETEAGVGAVGVAIRLPSGAPLAALSVAIPIGRLDRTLGPEQLNQVFHCRDEIAREAAELTLTSG
jgi:IclR family transcriptional regulator, acetate operon repressor